MPTKTYTEAEIKTPEFIAIINEAREMWRKRCAQTFAEKGDWGSCVIGAGIAVLVKPKGKRKGVDEIVIYPPTPAQGSCVWEVSQKDIVAFLQEKGIDAYFMYGHLD